MANQARRHFSFMGLLALVASMTVASTAPASASIQALFLPSGQPTAGLAQSLAGLPGVESAAEVFDRGEQAFLAGQGQGNLGAAVKLRIQDSEAFDALKARKDLPGKFEINPLVRINSAGVPNPEQWGLANTGKPQEVVISDIVSRFIKSVPGEDAGVAAAPAEVSGGRKVLVAVIDTGVEQTHPALASRIHRTDSECEAMAAFQRCMNTQVDKAPCHSQFDNLDTDGNGYPMDCSGWDVTVGKNVRTGLAGASEIVDNVGHGTHVSGIIAGSGFVSGVASQVEILPVKVLGNGSSTAATSGAGDLPDPHGSDFTQDSVVADVVARGVLYAIRSHAQVLNMSLGYSIHDDSEVMRQMVALAQSKGILIVAAAGNDSSRTPVYPCKYPGVVCVASFSADGSISHFSDFGDSVDIAAPGYSILSAWPTAFYPSFFTERPGYDFLSGTSMASPFVAGALARLLNHGFGPEEAVARLILGARPSLAPTAMAELEPKFTLSGNLDLARAFAVSPQPLIVPALKESVLVPLDRERVLEPKSSTFKLSLKNLWRDGSHVNVRVSVSADSAAARARIQFAGEGAELSRNFETWASGETREIQGTLSWSTAIAELPGEFYFEIIVSGPRMDTRVFKKSVEFVVPVRPMALVAPVAADPRITRVSTDLKAQSLPDNYAIKPITCLPRAANGTAIGETAAQDDLLLILKPNNSTILQLLKMTRESGGGSPTLKVSGGDVLDNAKEQLFAFSCLDYNGDGHRDYVVTSVSNKDKKFTLTFFDSLFRHTRDSLQLSFSSDVVLMNDDFRWISGINADKSLAPVFIGRGKKPDSELPGFDPWENRPADQVNRADQRLYYLDKAGLHSVSAPEGYHYVGLLKPTRQQLVQGTASVVLFKGSDFVLDFFVAPLAGTRLGTPEKLDFSIYQRLTGLPALAESSAADGGAAAATVYVEQGTAGRMRLSVKPSAGTPASNTLLPWVIEPTKPGDTLTAVIAAFGDSAESAQSFARSRFQLYFNDRKSNLTIGTDLKQYDSVTRHLPARVDGVPALLMPEGQGASLTTELIVPRVIDGKATLLRPASLKALGIEGCEQIQMKVTGLGGSGGGMSDTIRQLVYFCGDHFIEISL